jgi:hypothetical protein
MHATRKGLALTTFLHRVEAAGHGLVLDEIGWPLSPACPD